MALAWSGGQESIFIHSALKDGACMEWELREYFDSFGFKRWRLPGVGVKRVF